MEARVRTSYLQSLGYSVRDLAIPGSDTSYQCQPQITSSLVTFVIPYSSCGTTQQVTRSFPPPPAKQAFLAKDAMLWESWGPRKYDCGITRT